LDGFECGFCEAGELLGSWAHFRQAWGLLHLVLNFGDRSGDLFEPLIELIAVCSVYLRSFEEVAGEKRDPVTRWRVGTDGIDELVENCELRCLLLMIAFAKADWLKRRGKDAELVDVLGAGEYAKAGVFLGKVSQAEAFELDGDDVETAVHVVRVGDALWRPEAFCHRCGSGPDARVDGVGIKLLGPHADLSAENEFALCGGEGRVGWERIGEIVDPGGLHAIEVVGCGEDSLKALFCALGERGFAAPGLNDNVAGKGGVENFVPAHHVLVQVSEDFEDARIEVGLEVCVVFQMMRVHEGEDAWVGLPVGRGGFVTADVDVRIGKDGGHLAEEAGDEAICLFARGIELIRSNAELAADDSGRGSAGELRIGHLPGSAVAGHLKLRYDADAAVAGVLDDLSGVLLGIEEAVGADAGEFGIELALDAETLIFREVPVEDVELDGSHAVEGALDDIHWLEVPTAVDHKAAPWKAGRVVNGDDGDDVVVAGRLDELNESFEAVHGSHYGRSLNGDTSWCDGKSV